MENAIRALEIAAGVLLAVMLMAVAVYFFSSLSSWPKQEDDTASVEQLAQFNKEYEIYDKSAMYGVDVISCLNKAISNNEKYVEGGAFLSGHKYGPDYFVQVGIRLEKSLSETVEVYRLDKDNYYNEVQILNDSGEELFKMSKFGAMPKYTAYASTDAISGSDTKELSDKSKFIVPNGGDLEYEGKKYYQLVDFKTKDETKALKTTLFELASFSSENMKKTIKHTKTESSDEQAEQTKWSKAIWVTALYELKTRRFKCDDVVYSTKTGRVSAIYFSEISEIKQN